jgi:hypothetical protein
MPLFRRSNNFSETTLFTYKLNVRNLVGSIYKAVVSIQAEIYYSVTVSAVKDAAEIGQKLDTVHE